MIDQDTDWILLEQPTSATVESARAYFGVPPAPLESLAENINRKRRRWHSRSNGPSGSSRAREVKEIIKRLEDFLLKGAPFPHELVDGRGPVNNDRPLPPPIFATLEDLEQLVENLIQRGQFQRSIETARDGASRWPDVMRAQTLFAYTAAFAANSGHPVESGILSEAIRAGELVTNADPMNTVGWWCRGILLAHAGRNDEVLYLENEIVSRLGWIPPNVLLTVAQAVALTRDMRRGLEMVMRAVETDPTDSGLRLEAVTIALEVARRHLPLSSAELVTNFKRVVEVSAYCADGVASLEAEVRPFRMWAERCDRHIFVGSQRLRSFMSALTFFVWLPLHNSQRNKACWRVLLEGPVDGQAEFFLLSEMPYIRNVHSGVQMPWFTVPDRWPTRPVDADLN